MPEVLTQTSRIKLSPGPGWSWKSWDGVVPLYQALTSVSASGNPVVLEQHLLLTLSQVAGWPYEAIGFSDIPGMFATIVGTIDGGTLAQTVKAGSSRLALATVTGSFTATVGVPSSKITPGGPAPDMVLVKTGTWKVDSSAQDSVTGA